MKLQHKEALFGYIAISPWFIGFLIFSFFPIMFSLVISFYNWEVITPPVWNNFGNFRRLVNDENASLAIINTFYYTLIAVPLQLAAALFVSILLNRNIAGRTIYRGLIYFPSQMPLVAASMLWFFIFSTTFGLANQILLRLGLPMQRWLWDSQMVKPSLIIMSLWGIGNTIIIFLAGLQGIPVSMYEAADIDGANTWWKFIKITIPMLSPTIFFVFIIGFIGSFQIFTNVYLMTRGGPGNSSLMLVLLIYRNAFENFRMGYASLLAWILFLIVLLATSIQFIIGKRWVFYEGQ